MRHTREAGTTALEEVEETEEAEETGEVEGEVVAIIIEGHSEVVIDWSNPIFQMPRISALMEVETSMRKRRRKGNLDTRKDILYQTPIHHPRLSTTNQLYP